MLAGLFLDFRNYLLGDDVGLNCRREISTGCWRGVRLDEKEGYGGTKIGVEDFRGLGNHENRCFSAFGKWNRPSTSAKTPRIYVRTSGNPWFNKLSFEAKPQTPSRPGFCPGY